MGNENNLPPVEDMRTQVEAQRLNNIENDIHKDLARYKELFLRWKEQNDLNDDETKEMAGLSEKLESIKNQMNPS